MTELKFRVRDKNLGYYCNSNSYAINGHGEFVKFPMDAHENYPRLEDLVIEQYTSINDKNEVYIYEGDILKVYRLIGEATKGDENGGFNWYTEIDIGIVLWSQNCGSWLIEYNSYDDFDEMGAYSHRYEVMGNIHDSIELFKFFEKE